MLPECIPGCSGDSDCPAGEECIRLEDNADPVDEDCAADDSGCANKHCVPFRCPDVPGTKFAGSVRSPGFSAVNETGTFDCKEGYVIPGMNATAEIEVVCAMGSSKGRIPVSCYGLVYQYGSISFSCDQ